MNDIPLGNVQQPMTMINDIQANEDDDEEEEASTTDVESEVQGRCEIDHHDVSDLSSSSAAEDDADGISRKTMSRLLPFLNDEEGNLYGHDGDYCIPRAIQEVNARRSGADLLLRNRSSSFLSHERKSDKTDEGVGAVSGADLLLRNRSSSFLSHDRTSECSGVQEGCSLVSGADLLLRNRSSSFLSHDRTSERMEVLNQALEKSTNSRLRDRLVPTSNGMSLPLGHRSGVTSFSVMYEESLSQASRLQSVKNIPPKSMHSNLSDPPESSSGTGKSPYYERTGAWLRLRPQNPAKMPLNASRMTKLNVNGRYYSSRSSSSGNYSDIHRRLSTSLPLSDLSAHSEVQQPLEEKVVQCNDEDGSETVNAIDGECVINAKNGRGDCQHLEDIVVEASSSTTFHVENVEKMDLKLFESECNLIEDDIEKCHGEVSIPKVPIFHQLSSLPLEGCDAPSVQIMSLSQLNSSIVSVNDTQWASPDSKYERYACRVDQNQGDKSVEIPLFLFQRPHMRAFHFAWMSFFVAFFTWFAIAPLLPEIKSSLNLTHEEIWMSNVFSSAGTVICRVIVGPLNDRYGARWVMATTLVISSIPVMATGLVNTAVELSLLRLITGIVGSSFVTCQYWTSSMFTREVAGTANSLVAGWGNLGGGVTQIVMGSVLFPLFKLIYSSSDSKNDAATRAWRVVFVIPAMLSFVMAFLVIRYSDDSPKGNYRKLKRQGQMPNVEAKNSMKAAASNVNTWLLAFHYACCFGVEVTMTAGAALYFSDAFRQKTEFAAAIASIFGWMNLFARGLGGFISDIMNAKYGMKGRLYWQFVTLILEGIFLLTFAYANTLGSSIFTMVLLSLFVQSSEGSTYSIVPYVCPTATGSVAGLVGAGGNLGGVIFLLMIQEWNYKRAFKAMAICVICSSFLSFFISIRGYAGIIYGTNAPAEVEVNGNILLEKRGEYEDTAAEEHKTTGTSEALAERK